MTRRDALKAIALLPVVPEALAASAKPMILTIGTVRSGMTATCAVELARTYQGWVQFDGTGDYVAITDFQPVENRNA